MGAMKSWAAVLDELDAARTHWEQCNHAAMSATRAELEAHIRLERAKADHQREIRAWINSPNAPVASQDAPGTPPEGDCEETCAECGKPVLEDECDGDPPYLHVDCEAEYRQGRREAQSDAVADAVMFGEGKGGF